MVSPKHIYILYTSNTKCTLQEEIMYTFMCLYIIILIIKEEARNWRVGDTGGVRGEEKGVEIL